MFPPQDKLINLNLNKNFCLRDKKKQMGFDILRTVFIRRGDGAGEYCYLLCDENNPSVIIAATMIIVQSRKIKKKHEEKYLSWEQRLLDLQIDINVGRLRLVNNGNVLCDCFSIYN